MATGSLDPDSLDNWCDEVGQIEEREIDGETHDACVVSGTEIFVLSQNSDDMIIRSGDDNVRDKMNDPDTYSVEQDRVVLSDQHGHDRVVVKK